MPTTFQTKRLRRQQSEGEYRLYKAALEFDLTEPIVLETREDFKSEPGWRDHLQPYHHQVSNLITFCRRLPVTLLADDVGLGKTISAGLVMSELASRLRVKAALVVCPKLIGPQWKEELEGKFGIPAEIAVGRDLIAAKPDGLGAIITTYASARLHLDSIPRDRFQMLVLDEAHKLRNLYGVDTPPQVATKLRKALEERRFPFVLMLTATPIHNRLWDLYSLVDLLTVARGHQNPFGAEGAFDRKYIADNREQARRLKPDARDEFRSIVYGYMSRVRRGDARLYFPDREVQLHRVSPTEAELRLIATIAKPIQKLNRLAQISILQALSSSPDALAAQLSNMARNGTVPAELAATVQGIARGMPLSAKLQGLNALIANLKQQRPDGWRLVVFTTRVETQTTIQSFLDAQGLKVGIINGASGARNQATLASFRADPPRCHVIVSTEAGAEGVNLQAANVLVNFDLPWNPMIVEQRIGRVQRLASKHAKVAIFNIILRNTFEEYIVGRLMEKLQMASHAIGDIEALLEASGIDDDDDASFEERIRQLVVASLAGKDVELETRRAEESIARGKAELEDERETVNELLGDPFGKQYVGPRAPKFPQVVRSMTPREFALGALTLLGARVTQRNGVTLVEENGSEECIHFAEDAPPNQPSTLYAPGSPAFDRVVSEIVATGVHDVADMDVDPAGYSKRAASAWVGKFGASMQAADVRDVSRRFVGKALLRVRATVAHDAYERLVEVPCDETHSLNENSRSFLGPLASGIDDPRAVGIDVETLAEAAALDEAVGDFQRFYLERRDLEAKAAGNDERKRKKLEDDFTPRLETSVVGLEGRMYREVGLHTAFEVDGHPYSTVLRVRPHDGWMVDSPALKPCATTGRLLPQVCLARCDVSGVEVFRHLLAQSEKSARLALPEHTVICEVTGKKLIKDEAARSDVTGRIVDKSLLRASAASGKKAEPDQMSLCEVTGAQVLLTELDKSELTGRRYRRDQQWHSAVSGKTGHKDEFSLCAQTRSPLAPGEGERCEVTNSLVRPGILETCAVTRKRVLPSELGLCSITGKRVLRSELEASELTGNLAIRSELVPCSESGARVLPSELVFCAITRKGVVPSELEECPITRKRALKKLFVKSSISQTRLLHEAAIRSEAGLFCTPQEAKRCAWTSQVCHPKDLRKCELTGMAITSDVSQEVNRGHVLRPLWELLTAKARCADRRDTWDALLRTAAKVLTKGRCDIEGAVVSPTDRLLAVSIEVKSLFGFKTEYIGAVYAIDEERFVGRISRGQRKPGAWVRVEV